MSRERVVLVAPSPLPEKAPEFIRWLSGALEPQYESVYETKILLPWWPGPDRGKGKTYPAADARIAARKMAETLLRRRVVLLGRDVARAFGLAPAIAPFLWVPGERDWPGEPTRFAFCPYPDEAEKFWRDGRNRGAGARFFGEIFTGGETFRERRSG